MAAEENIRDELLKQNGESAEKMRELRDKILARDEARVARMKKLTIITWAIIVLSLATAFFIRLLLPEIREPGFRSAVAYEPYARVFFAVVWGLTMIAVFFTISFYIRSRELGTRQIQARLAGIEEQLKRIAEKQ